MIRLILLFAVFLSGCAVYGDERRYYRPGNTVLYQQGSSVHRGYYDDRAYRWHNDRYQDRRHSHYAPGNDGRYQWHDPRGRYERQREQSPGYVHPHGSGWNQRGQQQSWQLNGGRNYNDSRERGRDHRYERDRRGWEQKGQRNSPRGHSSHGNNPRGWSISR